MNAKIYLSLAHAFLISIFFSFDYDVFLVANRIQYGRATKN